MNRIRCLICWYRGSFRLQTPRHSPQYDKIKRLSISRLLYMCLPTDEHWEWFQLQNFPNDLYFADRYIMNGKNPDDSTYCSNHHPPDWMADENWLQFEMNFGTRIECFHSRSEGHRVPVNTCNQIQRQSVNSRKTAIRWRLWCDSTFPKANKHTMPECGN